GPPFPRGAPPTGPGRPASGYPARLSAHRRASRRHAGVPPAHATTVRVGKPSGGPPLMATPQSPPTPPSDVTFRLCVPEPRDDDRPPPRLTQQRARRELPPE